MPEASLLFQLVLVLATALVLVAASLRAGLGVVVGYLLAGMLLGPQGLAVIEDSALVRVLAEFGVVFLLFAIGLELPLARLRTIGFASFLLGGLQIAVTAALITAVARFMGAPPRLAIVIGLALSLSSTAVVLRLLSERDGLRSRYGRTAFAILMVQDVAVGPLLITVFALGRGENPLSGLATTLVAGLLFVVPLVLGGRRLLEWLYRRVAAFAQPELLVALSLLVGIGFAYATSTAGLSLGFGGFLAGMLLADTSFRHQVAADIGPFRGLLVGLFFLTVGLGLEIRRPPAEWLEVAAIALALLLAKGAVVAALTRAGGFGWPLAWRVGLLLAQGGEFAFVLFAAARTFPALDHPILGELGLAVALSMAATPLLVHLAGALTPPALPPGAVPATGELREGEGPPAGHVVVAGAGPAGQRVALALGEAGIPVVGLDDSVERVARARRRGLPFFFGEVTRPDILEDVHVERARALVLALEDRRCACQAAALLAYLFPELPVLVRVVEEEDCETFRRLGVTMVVPEIVATGRVLADATLRLLADRPAAPQPETAVSSPPR